MDLLADSFSDNRGTEITRTSWDIPNKGEHWVRFFYWMAVNCL